MPVTQLPITGAPTKRDAILEGALDLFAEHGFDATPVPMIAERAGVGAGTIYRYFESKEALVNALYQQWKGELWRYLVAETPAGINARESFRHWWRGLWRFATEHPRAFAFLETQHHAPYLDDESLAIGAEIASGARAFIERAQATGQVRGIDPATLIAMVLGSFTGLVKAAGPGGLAFDEERIAETEQAMWDMLKT
jgi:AcrR family transcriptional regulator